jgi:hypothetical protein
VARFLSALCLLASLTLLSACATRAPANPVQLPIYDSITSAPPRYEVVKRLWVGSLISVFGVPTYASTEDAMADFRRHAANLGGNGVINFGCYHLPGLFNSDTRLACNGTVVRFL